MLMDITKEHIKKEVMEIFKETIQYQIIDENENFFDTSSAYDMLYIVDPIENKFNIKFEDVILNKSHDLMTLENLSESIFKAIKKC